MKIDILAIGAHPDDIELGAGATIAKEIANGKTVGILDLTRGELGTRGTAETRDAEAEDAKNILGASFRVNMEFADGFFINDKEHQLKIIEMIRKYQPDIVVNIPTDSAGTFDFYKFSELIQLGEEATNLAIKNYYLNQKKDA